MAKVLEKTEKQIKNIIFQFLNPRKYRVFIFGSRATGKAREFSDYDIGILNKKKKPIPSEEKIFIEEALEESDIPSKVEIIDFSIVSDKFKRMALTKIKKL